MKKTLEELHVDLMDLYHEALEKRLCTSKGDFAKLVGVSRQNMSSAMNKSEIYLSERLLAKVEKAVRPEKIEISMENDGQAHDNIQKNFELQEGTQNEDVLAILQAMKEELRLERESHERIMMALIDKIGAK